MIHGARRAVMIGMGPLLLLFARVSAMQPAQLESLHVHDNTSRRKQQPGSKAEDPHPTNELIPTSWWIAGLVASAALATAVLSPMLGLPAYEPLVAVAMCVPSSLPC